MKDRHNRWALFTMEEGQSGRLLYRLGLASVLVLLISVLVLYAAKGSVYREWINPFSVSGSGAFDALDPGNLVVALVGTVGIPPLVVYTSFVLLLWGWFLVFFGLRRAGIAAGVAMLLLHAIQVWLLAGMLPGGHAVVAIIFGTGHLFCYVLARLGRAAWSAAAAAAGHFLLLAGTGAVLLGGVPDRMALTLGTAAAQVLTVLLLVVYWFVLGYDALDGSIEGGRKAGELGSEHLPKRLFTPLVAAGMLLAGGYLVLKGGFLLPFGAAILIGNLFFLYGARRFEPVRMHAAGNMLVYSCILVVVILQGLSVFLPDLELFSLDMLIPPVVLYAVTSVWGFLSSGPLFVDHPTAGLPAQARRFLHIGWVVLATNCLLFFVAARDDTFMALADRIGAEALLAVGLPVLIYLLFNNRHRVFPGTGSGRRRLPRSVPVLLALAILVLIQITRGLSVYTFARMTSVMAEGNVDLRRGEYSRAVRKYRIAAGIQPRNWKPLMMEGVARHLQGKRGQAVTALERAVGLEPEAVDAWLILGSIYREQKKYQKALQAYRKAEVIDPRDSFIYRNMGLCFSYMNRHKEAIRYIRKALKIMPGRNEFGTTHYAALGLVLMRGGRTEEAEAALRQALVLTPRDHLALSDIGVLLFRRGRYRESLQYLERAHRLRPEHRAILEQVLKTCDRLQDRNAAVRALTRAVRARPDDEEVAGRYIRALILTGRYRTAERELLPRLRRFPGNAELLYQHALLAIRRERYDAALARLNRLLGKKADHTEGLLQRAFLYRRQKRYGKALADYRQVLRLDPKNGSGLLFGGIITVRDRGKYNEGFRMLSRVLPSRAAGMKKAARITGYRYMALAAIRKQPRRIRTAVRAYRAILRDDARDYGALSNLNIIYGALKDRPRQAEMLARLLRYYPTRLIFRIQLALNLEKQGKKAEAVRAYRALLSRLESLTDRVYDLRYRKALKGYTREQMSAFCRSRIAALGKE